MVLSFPQADKPYSPFPRLGKTDHGLLRRAHPAAILGISAPAVTREGRWIPLIPAPSSAAMGLEKTTSRYGAASSLVFKAQRRAHSGDYVTEITTQKRGERATEIAEPFFDAP